LLQFQIPMIEEHACPDVYTVTFGSYKALDVSSFWYGV
jgi:hypothetical protein